MAALGIEDRFYARNVTALLPFAAALAVAAVTSVWVATDLRYEQVDCRNALARSQAIDRRATVIAVTRIDGSVVETYLARRPISSDLLAREAWIIVEPMRAAGQSFLSPAPAPELPGFTTLHTFFVEGFRLVLVGAGQPTRIAPAEVTDASVFLAGHDDEGPIGA
jgi:hypothetical protein